MIELIVGSALLLAGAFLYCWMQSAALRDRIEAPGHAFVEQAREFDGQHARQEQS